MKNITLLSFLFFVIACNSQTSPFDDEWIGQITLLGQPQHVRISAKTDTITLHLRDEGPDGVYSLMGIKKQDSSVDFTINHAKGTWSFTGQIVEGNRLEGNVQANGLIGKFLFFKRLAIEPEEWQPCLGNYQLASGCFLRIRQSGKYLDLHSGISERYTGLSKIGENRFYSASCEILQFDNLQNGQFQTVEWQSPVGQKINAQRVASFQVEDHLIITSTDTIGASLYLPASAGKHPACIIPIGAAPYNRLISDLEAEFFATYGIATLIYDNYGYGKSSGNLAEKSFVDKQQVAIELFQWMQNHPKIDAKKIGFRGASQGGRIALMAASALPETAFLALVATPMETRMDQQLYALSAFHRQQNFSEQVITHSTELWRKFFTYAATDVVDTAFVIELQTFRAAHPDMELPQANLGNPPFLPRKSDLLNSTSSYLPTVQCPVLCIFGALDDRVPAQKSIHQLRTGLEKAGQQPPTVVVYEEASHSFTLPGFRIIPGLFMDQIRFMRKAVELD